MVHNALSKKIKIGAMKNNKTNSLMKEINNKDNTKLLGYPLYPPKDDIYNKDKEEKNIDPEETSKTKSKNENGKTNQKDFREDVSGSDLDIPGSELDDNQENIGSEDEENNLYSLGGDNHENLDEDKAGI